MIISFKCRDTQKLFEGTRVKRWVNIETLALRKLAMLNRASDLNDLRIPPQNKLEALKKDRKGQHSIRVNDQWRVCFEWMQSGIKQVEIVDCHWHDESKPLKEFMKRQIPYPHPGEILVEEFLKPMNISAYRLAK